MSYTTYSVVKNEMYVKAASTKKFADFKAATPLNVCAILMMLYYDPKNI
jgi:hypothetical protein